MPFKLSGLMLNRVDLCPDGSNPDANIVLFKSKKEGHVPQKKAKKPAVKKTAKADTRKKARQRGDDEEDEDEDEAVAVTRGKKKKVVAKADDDEDEDDLDEDDDLEEEDDDEEDVRMSDEDEDDEDEDDEEADDDEDDEDVSKSTSRRKKIVAKRGSADEDEDDEDEDDDEDDGNLVDETVLKSLPAKARQLIVKQNQMLLAQRKTLRQVAKNAKEATRLANVEKDRRITLEYVEKAKKTLPNLTGTDEEKGHLLKTIYEKLDKVAAKAIHKLLKSGDAAVKSLMLSDGRTHRVQSDDDDSPVAQLREKAEEIRKADTKLTKEQAFEKACTQNPTIFAQYRLERKRHAVVS